MSLRDCIGRATSAGQMDAKRAEAILREYDNAFTEFQRSMGYTQAEIEAARFVAREARARAAEKRRVTQLQAAATKRNLDRMRGYRNLRGRVDPAQFLMDFVNSGRGAMGQTIQGKVEAVRRNLRRDLTETVRTFRANIIGGRRNAETLDDVGRELFGTNTGNDAAKRIADSFREAAERARLRFNAAGGHIGKLEGWALPQGHDQMALRRVGANEWADFIDGLLDWDRMAETHNSGLPFSPERRAQVLDAAHKAIRTEGYSRRQASGQGGRALYNRRADHRFFYFRDFEAWKAYNERFGGGQDAFRVMIGHLDRMALDIALMEELGPNPGFAFRHLADEAKRLAALSEEPAAVTKASAKIMVAEQTLDLVEGRTNVPMFEGVAKTAAATRNLMTSSMLGSAVLSAVTDNFTQMFAAAYVGIPVGDFVRQIGRQVASTRPRRPGETGPRLVSDLRAEANEAGLIFENAVEVGNAAARYTVEDIHVEFTNRAADFTIRAQGLGIWTEMHRQAAGLSFMTQSAKWAGQDWASLNKRTRAWFERFGIGEQDWRAIQRAQIHETANGLRILRPQEIEALGSASLADRYMEAVVRHLEYAIPSQDLTARAAFLSGTAPGSIMGEFSRTAMQFKSFGLAVAVAHTSRLLNEAYQAGPASALRLAAAIFIGGAIFGGAALQLKEITKGRDLRPVDDWKFWGHAILQGGGFGIFGDFLFADQNRFGGGLWQTAAGPAVGFAEDVTRLTFGNVQQGVTGKDMNIGGDMVDMLRKYTPGGSLWYIRLAFEREVLDQLEYIANPDAARKFRAREKYARDLGTEYFAPPGQRLIDMRAPDWSNVIGGR